MKLFTLVFSSFWVWLGFLILAATACYYIIEAIKAFRVPKKLEAYKIGDRWHIEISGAKLADELKAFMDSAGMEGENNAEQQ